MKTSKNHHKYQSEELTVAQQADKQSSSSSSITMVEQTK